MVRHKASGTRKKLKKLLSFNIIIVLTIENPVVHVRRGILLFFFFNFTSVFILHKEKHIASLNFLQDSNNF